MINRIFDFGIAARLLNQGKVGVIPTDTVYGLAAKASDIKATTQLYNLKHREQKPGTVIAASVQQLLDLGLPKQSLKTVERFWPGPVSVVIDLNNSFKYLHQGVGSVAFRVVDDKNINEFLKLTGPLITSSANQPGMPVSKNIDEAIEYFGDSIDFYLDNGEATNNLPSTIIKIVDEKIIIIRQGAKNLTNLV
jgi:L-threonylcarbamoyladenylate synthase